jgi:hypothetical protein
MPDRDLLHYLYKCSGAGKVFPETFWCAAFFLFKDTVEIGDIMKAAFVRDLRNSVARIHRHPHPH